MKKKTVFKVARAVTLAQVRIHAALPISANVNSPSVVVMIVVITIHIMKTTSVEVA